jgi:hypothetical protein
MRLIRSRGDPLDGRWKLGGTAELETKAVWIDGVLVTEAAKGEIIGVRKRARAVPVSL